MIDMTKDQEEKLYLAAHEFGMAAAAKAVVTPMYVGNAKSIFGDEIDYTKPVYEVADGVCGFAWVNIKPANGKFAKYMVKQGLARKNSYEGGVQVWVSEFNQSMTRKEAYARAFASVLQRWGINAYAGSRMD